MPMDEEIEQLKNDIKDVEGKIENVEGEITEVARKIEELESKLAQGVSDAEIAYFREEKRQLREEKRQLREKEHQLREKEHQLRVILETTQQQSLEHDLVRLRVTGAGDDGDPDKPEKLVSFEERPKAPNQLSTPSKNDDNSILKKGCVIVEREGRPLRVPVPQDFVNPYSSSHNEELKSSDLADLLAEKCFYAVASATVPAWICGPERGAMAKMNRSAVFTGTEGRRKYFNFADFEPELFTRVKDAENHPSPAYNGEIKSAGYGTVMFDEIATYVLFGVIDSFFRQNTNNSRLFYENVPVGYGLMGMSHVGYIVCLELVGKAIITPCTKPFFLGSKEHKDTVRELKQFHGDYNTVHQLDYGEKIFQPCNIKGDRIFITRKPAKDGFFWKIIRYDAYDGQYFQRAQSVYTAYKSLNEDELRQNHLVPAQLLYGENEVAVRMKFLEDCRSADDRNMNDEAIMIKVARAIVFLGKQNLLYTDLRGPNIMLGTSGAEVWLIDYDDMLVQDKPLTTMEDFEEALVNTIQVLGIPPQNNFMDRSNKLFDSFRRCLSELLNAGTYVP